MKAKNNVKMSETKRKLASIQRIKNISPIEGKDRILQAEVLGWKVIIGKDLYKENDLVCFFEIDSMLPEDIPQFADMEKVKFRVRTFKVNSPNGPIFGQGYCIPFDVFKKIVDDHTDFWDIREELGFDGSTYQWNEGDDVTELLRITKYEPPIEFKSGDALGAFPTHLIPQTDEIRVESKPEVMQELRGLPYFITQKADGTSCTILRDPASEIDLVCSRSLSLKNPKETGKESVYWKMYEKYNFEKILDHFPLFGFQMEIVGPGIQKNRMGLKNVEVRVFSIMNIKDRRYLGFNDFMRVIAEIKAMKVSDIETVKILESGTSFEHTREDLIRISNHKYDSGQCAEGIVIRPQTEMFSSVLGGRLSFKQISPEFLSKGGD